MVSACPGRDSQPQATPSSNIAAGQFFTLTASAVGSEASVDGIPSATGSSTLADLTITILGSSINIPLDPSPNDVIFDELGVKVTLNEQIHEVEGGFGDGIIVNAVAVDLDVLGVKGFIDIAQSKASISEARPRTLDLGDDGVGLRRAHVRLSAKADVRVDRLKGQT
jgi:hypothetical protein